MAGQNHHFTRYAPEPIPYAIERYVKETNRLYGVLNKRPRRPRVRRRRVLDRRYRSLPVDRAPRAQRQKLEDFPYLKRWFQAIHDRPATVRAYAKAASVNPAANMSAPLTQEARRVLFGQNRALRIADATRLVRRHAARRGRHRAPGARRATGTRGREHQRHHGSMARRCTSSSSRAPFRDGGDAGAGMDTTFGEHRDRLLRVASPPPDSGAGDRRSR